VRTLRCEHAEWDRARQTWQAPGRVSTVTFRRDGQASGGEFHNPDGSIARWARVYDAGGRVVEAQSWMDDEPGTRRRYSYDTRGRLAVVEEEAADGGRRQAESYSYDAGGRKTKISALASAKPNVPILYAGFEGTEQAYGAAGAATLSVAYDDRELPAEATFRDANGALIRRIVFSRDREGRLLNEVAQFPDESPFSPGPNDATASTEEGAKMAAVLKAAFPDHVLSSTTYAYDENGRLLERTVRMGTLSEERTTFGYDDRDNPIAEILESRSRGMDIDDDGAARTSEEEPRVHHHRLEYRYDDRGNWTERVVSGRMGSEPEFQRGNIERRTITYHDAAGPDEEQGRRRVRQR